MKTVSILFALLFLAVPAHGQGLLDFQKEAKSRRYDMYMADVAQGITATLDAWDEAWSHDDAEGLARVYRKDATLYLQDDVLHGRDAIRLHFEELLPHVVEVSLFPVDLDASGDMAYRVMRVLYEADSDAGPSRQLERRDIFIFRKDWSDDWAIEAHFEGPEEAVEGP
jgi:uncharacterized protein (TIGR02246 family)